ncbi:MAG: glycosyltransferase family 39 protein [Verrucomicrobiota bacterium JB022]|nr:glycosyltransferase family 39 protein [Verrucomicrobiota bacterium JB022]
MGLFAFTPQVSVDAFTRSVYGTLLSALILCVCFWARFERKPGGILTKAFWLDRARQRRLGIALLAAVVGTLFIVRTQDYAFKTIWDEHVIANTAQNLYTKRVAFNSGRVYNYSNARFVLSPFYDKRPAAFPFFVALTHDLFGYDPHRTIQLNACLAFGAMFLFFLLLQRLWGLKGAAFGLACLVTVPVFASEASSGGIGMSSIFLVLALIALLARWLERPDKDGLAAAAFLAVLLAQTRYESFLYLAGMGLVVAYVWWQQKRIMLPWVVLLCPVLLIPHVWQNHVVKLNPKLLELGTVGKEQVLSFGYIPEMSARALHFFFDPEVPQSNHIFLAGIAAIAAVGWLVLARRKASDWSTLSPTAKVAVLFIPAFLLQLLLILCYAFPLDMQITSRLSLPLFLPMAALAAWLLIEVRHRWVQGVILGGFVLFFMQFQITKFNRVNFYTSGMVASVFEQLEDELDRFDPDNTVFISTDVPFFDIFGYNAAGAGSFQSRLPQVKWILEQKEHPRFLVWDIESYNGMTGEWEKSFDTTKLTDNVKTEVVWTVYEDPYYRGVLSEVIAIEDVEAAGPAAPFEHPGQFKGFYYSSLP